MRWRGEIGRALDASRRVLLLGYGKSGASVHALLRARGTACRVADRSRPHADVEWLADDDTRALDDVDLVVKSPGFAVDHPLAVAARAAGLPVAGELEVGWSVTPARLISITGSNGKSTVTTLLAHMLRAAGREAVAAGNIGDPLSEVGPTLSPEGVAVVSISG